MSLGVHTVFPALATGGHRNAKQGAPQQAFSGHENAELEVAFDFPQNSQPDCQVWLCYERGNAPEALCFAESNAINDGCMIQLVRNDRIFCSEQRLQKGQH